MSAVTEAIADWLLEDGDLISLLSSYKGSPAIFTTDPAPLDAALPFIVTSGEAVNEPFDTKTSRGRSIIRDIRCYTDRTGSTALVEEIADRVRSLFHRASGLTVQGFSVWLMDVSGPISADEEKAYGRILSIRLGITETSL